MRVVAKGKVTHKQSIIFFLFTAEYITMPVLKVIFGIKGYPCQGHGGNFFERSSILGIEAGYIPWVMYL